MVLEFEQQWRGKVLTARGIYWEKDFPLPSKLSYVAFQLHSTEDLNMKSISTDKSTKNCISLRINSYLKILWFLESHCFPLQPSANFMDKRKHYRFWLKAQPQFYGWNYVSHVIQIRKLSTYDSISDGGT